MAETAAEQIKSRMFIFFIRSKAGARCVEKLNTVVMVQNTECQFPSG